MARSAWLRRLYRGLRMVGLLRLAVLRHQAVDAGGDGGLRVLRDVLHVSRVSARRGGVESRRRGHTRYPALSTPAARAAARFSTRQLALAAVAGASRLCADAGVDVFRHRTGALEIHGV